MDQFKAIDVQHLTRKHKEPFVGQLIKKDWSSIQEKIEAKKKEILDAKRNKELAAAATSAPRGLKRPTRIAGVGTESKADPTNS